MDVMDDLDVAAGVATSGRPEHGGSVGLPEPGLRGHEVVDGAELIVAQAR
jgi:hypothetical protein